MITKAYVQGLLPPIIVSWLRRKRGAWRKRQQANLRLELIAKYGTFTTEQLIAACRQIGVRENGILFVQCSYNDLLTYRGTPYELLGALRQLVGAKGTLLMPAFTTNMSDTPCRPFDVLSDSTYTGIIPELFRREEGVLRSVHPRHSICGLGPHAAELLAGHENCVYADGLGSPFDKMRRISAESLCLGLRPGFHSFVHWVEDIEPGKYPIKVHDGPFECALRNAYGEEFRRFFYGRCSGNRGQDWLIGKHLGQNAMRTTEFHGVPLCVYHWPAFADELLALRDRGLVCFR